MKKLIRNKIKDLLKQNEYYHETDRKELNRLYSLKVKEELNEIIQSDFKDEKEFADLLTVVISFANINGIPLDRLLEVSNEKISEKGDFSNVILTNLNPENKSNEIYISGSLIEFGKPNQEGIIFSKDAFSLNELNQFKMNGIIKDYEIDENGIKIIKSFDLNSVSI